MKRSWAVATVVGAALIAVHAWAADDAQSLYDESHYKPLTAEAKAWRVGDLLTVVVQEAATATTAADSRSQRNNNLSASIGSNKVGPHTVTGSTATDNDGGGRTQRSGKLLATLTVRVTGHTSSGDLTVQGEQQLVLNGERQLISLSGVVRPRDIAGDNTVASFRIADARIDFDGEGFIADKSKPSWIARFLSAIGL